MNENYLEGVDVMKGPIENITKKIVEGFERDEEQEGTWAIRSEQWHAENCG